MNIEYANSPASARAWRDWTWRRTWAHRSPSGAHPRLRSRNHTISAQIRFSSSIHWSARKSKIIRHRARRIAEQTFIGEGEPLEVGVALLLEVPFLGRRVRPHLSPRLDHPPLSSLVRRGEERREGGEARPERQAGNWCLEENATRAEARARERLPAG